MEPTYKLTELLGAAGATSGVIIAGTIFLQFLSARYADLAGRYRALTGELRNGVSSDNARHDPLQVQIKIYRHRLQLITWASALSAIALLCFLLSVVLGGLSVIRPEFQLITTLGSIGLGIGLALIIFSVVLELIEIITSRHEHNEEIADLNDG